MHDTDPIGDGIPKVPAPPSDEGAQFVMAAKAEEPFRADVRDLMTSLYWLGVATDAGIVVAISFLVSVVIGWPHVSDTLTLALFVLVALILSIPTVFALRIFRRGREPKK